MPVDVERVHERTLPDGTAYDVYLPSSFTPSTPARLMVSAEPGGANLPRFMSLELCADIAEATASIIVALRSDRTSGFNVLGLGTPTRFDLRLLEAVETVGTQFNADTSKFDMYGYSAGGQFAHRFLYLHPDRLAAVAIGAPGMVTVPNMEYPWPWGLAGLSEVSGLSVDFELLRKPRILLFVGDQDVVYEGAATLAAVAAHAGIDPADAQRYDFGATRVERARTLHNSWIAAGIPHAYVEVEGMGHTVRNANGRTLVHEFFAGK